MDYVVNSAEFGDRWHLTLFSISVNSTQTVLLLYALYVVLFLFSIHFLRRRRPAERRVLLLTAWAMFLLATSGTLIVVISAGISMRMMYLFVQGSNSEAANLLRHYHTLALTVDIILALNNLVTDSLFLYRCYVIWGCRKMIIVVPGALIVVTVVVGCISGLGYYNLITLHPYIDPRVPFIMGGATNILLMCLTAGRIWYIRRQGQILTGKTVFKKQYDTAVAIILESGLIYCLCAILYVTSASINSNSASATIFNGVSWGVFQLGVNIVPTLILVRVGMGRSTENTAPVTSTMGRNTAVEYPIFASRDSKPIRTNNETTQRIRGMDEEGAFDAFKMDEVEHAV
ncbi:hypothetical protein C8R44DRAFT_790552 [Mycena epipterygia]|nr:hypothetical protein C8R44DRAFT_790552 [Mycena epipterygia]